MDTQKLIAEYEAAARRPRQAIAGLACNELLAYPVPGTWSIHQIIHHIVDADLISTDRMKRVVAEDRPTLIGFDQTRFAQHLHYELQSIEDALTIFELNRKQFTIVLRQLPANAFDRIGVHNERGELRLADLVGGMTGHVDHHLKFVRQKRSLLGK